MEKLDNILSIIVLKIGDTIAQHGEQGAYIAGRILQMEYLGYVLFPIIGVIVFAWLLWRSVTAHTRFDAEFIIAPSGSIRKQNAEIKAIVSLVIAVVSGVCLFIATLLAATISTRLHWWVAAFDWKMAIAVKVLSALS